MKFLKRFFCKHDYKMVLNREFEIIREADQKPDGTIRLVVFVCEQCKDDKMFLSDRTPPTPPAP